MYTDDRNRIIRNYDQTDAPTEIVSFPSSVQNRLAQAHDLLRQGRPSEALTALQQAGTELARTSPELFVLAVASQLGARSITLEQTEMDTTAIRTDRHAFGVRYGHDVKTTTNTNVKRKTFTLG